LEGLIGGQVQESDRRFVEIDLAGRPLFVVDVYHLFDDDLNRSFVADPYTILMADRIIAFYISLRFHVGSLLHLGVEEDLNRDFQDINDETFHDLIGIDEFMHERMGTTQ
jgi:hypothetical protein